MSAFELSSPLAFFIFNRPETTKIVFEEIRKAAPKKLLVIADGPRQNKTEEKERCEQTREIINTVDWECELIKNYSDNNLGCKKRLSTGIGWVFENVDEAIILEDDCMPNQSFFRFCQELLLFYRYDERIMMISGNNFQLNMNIQKYSYYFSAFNHIWGWASWKRAWENYDLSMKKWPELKSRDFLSKILSEKEAIKYWETIFQDTFNGKIDTWDYQWLYSCWLKNGLAVIPKINLVTNIGFGDDATHTKHTDNTISNLTFGKLSFPLIHPPSVKRDESADRIEETNFYYFSKKEKIKRFLKSILTYAKA
jgi:hypothetical protein